MSGRQDGSISLRPLQLGDLDALDAIDAEHSSKLGVRAVLSRASVHYYQRSGHSFLAERDSAAQGAAQAVGFILAHPSWSGAEAVVRVERIAVLLPAKEAAPVASSLTEAVVKSAYDAGVYRLVASVAAADEVARAALETTRFDLEPSVAYRRLLGSGALSGASPGRDEHGVKPVERSRRRA